MVFKDVKGQNMSMGYRRYLPILFQMSVFGTMPWLVSLVGVEALWCLPMAWFYHWLIFSLTGHMVISHGRQSVIPNQILYMLFFYSTYITPHIWAGLHIQHHKHPDTELDPQSPDYLGFITFLALYDISLCDRRTMVKHLRTNSMSKFIWRWYLLLLSVPVMFTLLTDIETSLFYYWVPVSLSFTIATFSAWYTHSDLRPRKYFHTWARFLFLGESEYHDRHHEVDWNHCDPTIGWLLKS